MAALKLISVNKPKCNFAYVIHVYHPLVSKKTEFERITPAVAEVFDAMHDSRIWFVSRQERFLAGGRGLRC